MINEDYAVFLGGSLCIEVFDTDNLVTQFFVLGPAFTVSGVSILDDIIGLVGVVILVASGVIDADSIQIDIVAALVCNIHQLVVCSGDTDIVLLVSQTVNLDDGNLIQSAGGRAVHDPLTICVFCVAVEGVDHGVLLHSAVGAVSIALPDLDGDQTGGRVGQRDHIEAGTVEGELSGSVGVCVNGDLGCALHGMFAHFLVSAVVTVDIVGIHKAMLAGTVLCLDAVGSAGGPAVDCGAVGVEGLQSDEIVLVVDGGCGDHGDVTVVVMGGFSAFACGCGIGEAVIGVHSHVLVIELVKNLCAVHGCGTEGSCNSIAELGCIGRSVETAIQAGLSRLVGGITDAQQLTVDTQHIVCQDRDVHGQTVVNNHGIVHDAFLPLNSEPYGGSSVTVTVTVGLRQCVGILVAVVAGDIGGTALAICRQLAAVDEPAAAAGTGVGGNSVSCSAVIDHIAAGENAGIDGVKIDDMIRTCAVQQDLLGNNRIGDLVSKGEVGSLVAAGVQGITLIVNQVEGVTDGCGFPCNAGGDDFLLNGVADPVDILHLCVVIGGIVAGVTLTLNGAFQIDQIGQGVLFLVDGANIPNKSFGINGLAAHGLLIGSGIVVEALCADHIIDHDVGTVGFDGAVSIQNRCDNRCIVGQFITACGGICLDNFLTIDGGCGKQNSFKLVGSTVCLTNIGIDNNMTVDSHADLGGQVDIVHNNSNVGGDSVGGDVGAVAILGAGLDGGVHLQIEVITQLVREDSVFSSLGDFTADCVKCLSQCAFIFSLNIMGFVTCNISQGMLCGSFLNRTVVTHIEGQGVHGSTQTGKGVHVIAACLVADQNIVQIGSCLADNGVGSVGITLDGICHTMLVAVGCIIVMDVVLAGYNFFHCNLYLLAVNGLCLAVDGTGQPVIPKVGTVAAALGTIVVILVSSTIGHEDDIQGTLIFAVCFLDSMTELINSIKSVVIVSAGCGAVGKLRYIQIRCGNKCICI